MKKTLAGLSLAVALTSFGSVFASLPASAATIDFGSGSGDDPYVEDGFSFNPDRIQNGNCIVQPCIALNNNETTVMTYITGLFNLISINFQLLGSGTGNTLQVFETTNIANTISLSTPPYLHNEYYFYDFGSQFLSVSSITFKSLNGGNVRIDNLEATAKLNNTVVPIPAALPMLLGGIGGMTWLSRRQKRKGFRAA